MAKFVALPVPPKEVLEEMYHEKLMYQKDIGKIYGVTQTTVSKWMMQLGIKTRDYHMENKKGVEAHRWRGDKASYASLHNRVERARGKPRYCEKCGNTKAKRYEWANLTGNYNDINDYSRMCKSCHSLYDNERRRITGESTITVPMLSIE